MLFLKSVKVERLKLKPFNKKFKKFIFLYNVSVLRTLYTIILFFYEIWIIYFAYSLGRI